jgi:hypothetical protein
MPMKGFLPLPEDMFPPEQRDLWRVLQSRMRDLAEAIPSQTATTAASAPSAPRAGFQGYSGTHQQRLALTAAQQPEGTTFTETDRGNVVYQVISSGANQRDWKPIAGIYRDTLANKPTDLGSNDTGFKFWATNYYRLFRWTGSAWEYAEGELPAKTILWYPDTLPAGYALCDGSAVSVTASNATAANFTTPDLTGQYPKGGVYTGSVVAAVAPGITGDTANESAHTHSIDHDHPATASVGTAVVQSGAGISVAAAGATVDPPNYTGNSGAGTAHKHGVGTLVADTTGEPAHVLLLPIIKL